MVWEGTAVSALATNPLNELVEAELTLFKNENVNNLNCVLSAMMGEVGSKLVCPAQRD